MEATRVKITAFVMFVIAHFFTMIATSQQVFAGDIGQQLSNMGREATGQAITLISDVLQFAVGPLLLAVALVFLIIKIVSTFVGVRKNEEIDVKGLIISGIGVIVAGLMIAFRIDSFITT